MEIEGSDEKEEPLNLYDYLSIIWKYRYLTLALCLVSLVCAFVVNNISVPSYKASALVIPGLSEGEGAKPILSDSLMPVTASVNSGVFTASIFERLKKDGVPLPAEAKITAVPKKDTDYIELSVVAENPETARRMVGILREELSNFYRPRARQNIQQILRANANEKAFFEQVSQLSAILKEREQAMAEIITLKKSISALSQQKEFLLHNLDEADSILKTNLALRDTSLKGKASQDITAQLYHAGLINQNYTSKHSLANHLLLLQEDLDKQLYTLAQKESQLTYVNRNALPLVLKSLYNAISSQLQQTGLWNQSTEESLSKGLYMDADFSAMKEITIKADILSSVLSIDKISLFPLRGEVGVSLHSPKKARNLALALVVSLCAGILLSFLVEAVLRAKAKRIPHHL